MKKRRHDIAKINAIICLFLLSFAVNAQIIPAKGQSDAIDICNWNLEWFGKTSPGYGPSDDVLQQQNIYKTILQADMDLWAFCEIASISAFDSMMSKLPDYGYVISTFFPEQKTACIYKKSQFRLQQARLVGISNKDSFSTGRFPFEITLIPLDKTGIDTLFMLVLHLKSNIGTDTEKMAAYNSRKRSSEWLRMYLETTHKNHYCMVLGDWNDDIDVSIYNSLPSPFTELQKKGLPYTFITRPFTLSNMGTTTAYNNPIDHQLVSDRLLKFYMQDSSFIWHLNDFIPDYDHTTSDHYPVYSKFSLTNSSVQSRHISYPRITPQPANTSFNLSDIPLNCGVKIMTLQGQCLYETLNYAGEDIHTSEISNGLYLLVIESPGYKYHEQLLIQH